TRNNTSQQFTTNKFVIHAKDSVQLSTNQCPGYIAIEWHAVTNAGSYEILRKMGPYMQPVDTVTATNYTFKGMSTDSIYYVSMRPIIDGLGGYRCRAVIRQPNDGSCAGSISDGDLMLERLDGPVSGRKLTSTALGSNESIVFGIRNLDDAACNNYKLSYSINGGAWQSQTLTTTLAANAATSLNIGGDRKSTRLTPVT